MKCITLGALLLGAACTSNAGVVNQPSITRTLEEGILRLTVTDFATPGGVLWARPVPVASPSKITFQATRYGSLCRYDVSGHASVSAGAIAVHVIFTQRVADCSQEIRALSYAAELAASAGTYDLVVVHDDGGASDTVIHQSMVVP